MSAPTTHQGWNAPPGTWTTPPPPPPARPAPAGKPRRGLFLLIAFVLLAAVLLPMATLFSLSWRGTGENASFVADERRGVTYLRPVTRLVGALTDARAAAVRRQKVDTAALRSASAAVDEADQNAGAELGARERWTTLKSQVEALAAGPEVGLDAYQRYSGTIALAIGLMAKVGDTSKLILDPELDSYYLMDTVLLRLPKVITFAGQVADLSTLASEQVTAFDSGGAIRISVARDRVAAEAEGLNQGLQKAFDTTASRRLASNLIGPLDAFTSAVGEFAPPTSQLGVPDNVPDAGALTASRSRLQGATMPLASAVLNELDRLLESRAGDYRTERAIAVGVAAIGVLAGLAVIAVRLPRQDRAESPDDGLDDEPEETDSEQVASVVDARDLLVDELVHMGRAVRPRRGESR